MNKISRKSRKTCVQFSLKINSTCRKNVYVCFLILMVTLFLSSCATPVGMYSPDPKIVTAAEPSEQEESESAETDAKSTETAPERKIYITNPVKIVNSQSSAEERPLDFRGIIVNYKEFTQSLVEAIKLEYEKNNVTVSDSAEKVLNIKVTDVDMRFGAFNYRGTINAQIKGSDNLFQLFEASRASYGSGFMVSNYPTKPLDSAFKDIVVKIVYDEKIQDYINK